MPDDENSMQKWYLNPMKLAQDPNIPPLFAYKGMLEVLDDVYLAMEREEISSGVFDRFLGRMAEVEKKIPPDQVAALIRADVKKRVEKESNYGLRLGEYESKLKGYEAVLAALKEHENTITLLKLQRDTSQASLSSGVDAMEVRTQKEFDARLEEVEKRFIERKNELKVKEDELAKHEDEWGKAIVKKNQELKGAALELREAERRHNSYIEDLATDLFIETEEAAELQDLRDLGYSGEVPEYLMSAVHKMIGRGVFSALSNRPVEEESITSVWEKKLKESTEELQKARADADLRAVQAEKLALERAQAGIDEANKRSAAAELRSQKAEKEMLDMKHEVEDLDQFKSRAEEYAKQIAEVRGVYNIPDDISLLAGVATKIEKEKEAARKIQDSNS